MSKQDNEEVIFGSDFEDDEEFTFKDVLENEEELKLSNTRSIYKCKIKFIYEAFHKGEISLSEHNRMIDNSRIEELKCNFDINKCDSIILAACLGRQPLVVGIGRQPLVVGQQPLVESDALYNGHATSDALCNGYVMVMQWACNGHAIIDGQHRVTMITQLDTNDPIMEACILLDVRKCKDDEEFKEYINSTNNRKNFSCNQLRSFKYPILKDILIGKFLPHGIFTLPYVKLEESLFKSELFKSRLFEDFEITPVLIVDKLIIINDFFKKIEDKSKLSTTCNMTKKTYIKHRTKAEQVNFFLGLDTKYHWMKLLDCESTEMKMEWDKIFNQFSKSKK